MSEEPINRVEISARELRRIDNQTAWAEECARSRSVRSWRAKIARQISFNWAQVIQRARAGQEPYQTLYLEMIKPPPEYSEGFAEKVLRLDGVQMFRVLEALRVSGDTVLVWMAVHDEFERALITNAEAWETRKRERRNKIRSETSEAEVSE